MSQQKAKRKELIGTVVTDKMSKTVVVRVERLARHPVYEKVIRHYAKYKAHDQESKAKVGDRVKIVQTRPLSSQKRWLVLEVVT